MRKKKSPGKRRTAGGGGLFPGRVDLDFVDVVRFRREIGFGERLVVGGDERLGVHAQMLDELRFDGFAQFRGFVEQGANLFLALSELFGTEGEPCAALVHDPGIHAEVDEFARA